MNPIPLHRVAVLRPFTKFLTNVGAPVERGLRHAGLPVCALEDVNNYVPSHRYWAFLVDMAYREGIPNLGFHVGQKYGANCADPHLSDLLSGAPTVHRGLWKASELVNRTVSHCQLGLVHPPRSQYVYFYHRPSCDAHNPAIQQIGWFGIMTLIGMVRAVVGPHWQPAEIGLMTDQLPCRHIREQFPGTPVRLLQPYSYIGLERALLCLPPLGQIVAEPAPSMLQDAGLPTDFLGSVKKLLLSYAQERNLSVGFAAALCDMSTRGLQRKLAASNTCYSDVVDQVRFELATRMLRDPGKQVTDIAYLLGYTGPTHFSRAFRRIAGVSPRAYRQAQLH